MSAIYDNDLKHNNRIWLEQRYPDYTVDCDWQIIFINNDGLDYCRVQQPNTKTIEQVIEWAELKIDFNSDLAKAKIERF